MSITDRQANIKNKEKQIYKNVQASKYQKNKEKQIYKNGQASKYKKTKKIKYIKTERQANIKKNKQIYIIGQASVQRTRPIGFPGQACKTAQGSL